MTFAMKYHSQSHIQWISVSVAASETLTSFCRQVIFSSVLSSSLRHAPLLDKPLQFEITGKKTANIFAQNDCSQ